LREALSKRLVSVISERERTGRSPGRILGPLPVGLPRLSWRLQHAWEAAVDSTVASPYPQHPCRGAAPGGSGGSTAAPVRQLASWTGERLELHCPVYTPGRVVVWQLTVLIMVKGAEWALRTRPGPRMDVGRRSVTP